MNEVICHGIPDTRELEDGDICNGKLIHSIIVELFNDNIVIAVDITVYHGGFHGDLNETFFVGNVDADSRKLVQTAYECMMKGIEIGEQISL